MAITITVDGDYTLDESSGLDTGADGTPSGSPRDDSDVDVTTLPTAFYDFLFTDLALDDTFATDVGAAQSASDIINIASEGPIDTVGFTGAGGVALDGTQSSGLFTTDGDEVFLWSAEDGQVVLGKTAAGDVVFAVYLEPGTTASGSTDYTLWSVTFEPIDHGTNPDQDDAVDLLQNAYLTATGSQTFNFDDLPSGSNLFGSVADDPAGVGILVCGRTPVMDSNGKYTNASDVIHTSQGGIFATIGVNNQMFDAGEGAYFTFVNDIDNRYLSGLKPGGLTQTEADDGDNMLYDSLQGSSGAFIGISQIQGNDLATMKVTAFELDSAFQGRNLISNLGDPPDDPVTILHVVVYDANGGVLEDTDDLLNFDDPDIEVTFNSDGSVTVSGLDAGYKVEWETDGDHNQALIEGVAGKFDVGFFGLTEGAVETASLAGHVFVEDDGPSLGPIDDGVVQYTAGQSVTKSLNGDAGNDASGVYSITDFTESFTYLGITVIAEQTSDTEVIYFEDKGGTAGSYDDGTDLLYYTMALDGTGSGNYTFTVNNAPAPPPLTFDFDSLPSGSNLFGSVADSPDGPGLFVFGRTPVLSNNTKYNNASDVIHTSQGGIGATIGVNNQMFDPGEGAYFTFVDDVRDNFLSGVSGGLTSTEADYGKNLLYDGGLHETDGAFLGISQIQAGSLASMKITAYELDSAYQGTALIDNRGDPGDAAIEIDHVIVYDENGVKIEDTDDLLNFDDATVEVIFNADGSVTVNSLDAGYTVEWGTVGDHNQVLVEATGGKFDVGFFGFSEAQAIPDQVLDFEVTLTDGDDDPIVQDFSVTVDAVPYIV